MTKALLNSSIHKIRLLKNKLKYPNDINKHLYKEYCNIFNKLKRKAKSLYFRECIENAKNNIKDTWAILNQALNKTSSKPKLPDSFEISSQNVTDKASKFNTFFAEIGETVSKNVPETQTTFENYMPKNTQHTFFLTPVGPPDIINIAKKLKAKCSQGFDNISTKLIKKTIEEISKPLSHIINLSFQNGDVPDKMKIAKIIPIFKSGEQNKFNNYRPISLLPAFSKIIEKLVASRVVKYFNQHNLFYKHQYGFRTKHSTIHPMLHFINHITNENDISGKNITAAIFLDLSKVFDTISHNILLKKNNILWH